jgi:hypothetical protein
VLLECLAENMFYDPENPEYVHPKALDLFKERILSLESMTRMKLKMKPLHKTKESIEPASIVEKPGKMFASQLVVDSTPNSPQTSMGYPTEN